MTKKCATWLDLARRATHPQTITDAQADALLWNCSPFPFTGPFRTFLTLRDTWRAGGRTFDGAMAEAEASLDRAMRSTP